MSDPRPPRLADATSPGGSFARLLDIMVRLRSPTGCAWDREQTHLTLAPHLLEETYEVLDAIEHNDPESLCDELGDILLQVVFHSQIAADDGGFDAGNVIEGLIAKLVRRHPHVFSGDAFSDEHASTARDVVENWERIKQAERQAQGKADTIPKHLPALARAQKFHRRAARKQPAGDTLAHIRSLLEVPPDEAMVGALLLAAVALSAEAGVDAEGALRRRLPSSYEVSPAQDGLGSGDPTTA